MSVDHGNQVTYWDDLASIGPDSVLDPRDTRGDKNRYIRSIRDLRLLMHLGASTRGRVLDFGCGSGSVVSLLEETHHDVIGADISLQQLGLARNRVSSPLVQISGHELPFADGTFDAITTYVVLGHILDRSHLDGILLEMKRVLVNGGSLLAIEQTARNSRVVDGGFKYLRTTIEYESAFSRAGFDVVSSQPVRGGHFPLIYAVRAGLTSSATWSSLRKLDRWYSTSPFSMFDYRDTEFICVPK